MSWQTASPNHINCLKPLKPLLYITTQDCEGNTAKELQANWKIIHLRCREDHAPFLRTFIETRSTWTAACMELLANLQTPRDITCSFLLCLAGFAFNNSWEMQKEKNTTLQGRSGIQTPTWVLAAPLSKKHCGFHSGKPVGTQELMFLNPLVPRSLSRFSISRTK